jgi:DNA (cytosine-5)-methyltransferase 1
LCCGAGGITLGFENAGIETALAVDIEPVVIETHEANFPGRPVLIQDVARLHGRHLPQTDVWTCGIPCANYSIGGNHSKNDPVTWQLIRLLDEASKAGTLPDYLFLENVLQYMAARPSNELRAAIDRVGLARAEAIFKHADYGAASIRRRWHLIAYPKGASRPWPVQTHIEGQNLVDLLPWIRFGDIRQKRVMSPKYMSATALKGIIRRQRRKTRTGIEKGCSVHQCLYIVEDGDMMYTMMASAYKGLSRNQAVVVAHGHGFREPTELEWRRCQGFPDDFIFMGTRRQRYEQIGRAVPPPASTAFAKAIKENS